MDIFRATDTQGRENLVDLTNHTFAGGLFTRMRHAGEPGKGGHSALLDKDKDGHTLLSNLPAMATGPLAPTLEKNGITRDSLLASVMEEAGKPGEINQSNRGTCTVTSMQYMLCKEDPAEYVRLMLGLTSPTGTVELRNGATLKREEDSVPQDDAWSRSASERMFQAAMMEYANGGLNYSNVTDKNTGSKKILGIFNKHVSSGGLGTKAQERGLQGLFGKDFEPFTGFIPDISVDVLKKYSGRDLLMDLSWGGGGHAVTLQKIEGDRVYFRNPWGSSSDKVGTTYSKPNRRLEDPANGIESMSLKDFKKCFKRAYLPG